MNILAQQNSGINADSQNLNGIIHTNRQDDEENNISILNNMMENQPKPFDIEKDDYNRLKNNKTII